jgi:multimeric flavodoxin WrbA
MKVILVNGSPHEKNSTFTALHVMAEQFHKEGIDTEIFWIGNKPLNGCIGCKACAKLSRCVFQDKVNEFTAKAKNADGFIFASPVHYASASGSMTSFMDRAFYSEFVGDQNQAFYLKPAAAVSVARRAGSVTTYDQMNKYFGLHQMPIISSTYWNLVYGTNPEEILQDVEGCRTLRTLARNMAYFIKCQQIAQQAGVQLPEAEKPVFMNFIR